MWMPPTMTLTATGTVSRRKLARLADPLLPCIVENLLLMKPKLRVRSQRVVLFENLGLAELANSLLSAVCSRPFGVPHCERSICLKTEP